MAFLRIDGYAVDVMVEDFESSDVSVESFERSSNDLLQGITYSVKHAIAFRTPPLTPDESHQLEGWIRGRKHLWTFDRTVAGSTSYTTYSADAGLNIAGGTSAVSPLFGIFSHLLASGASSSATATFGSEGDWTVAGYQKLTSETTYKPFAVRSKGGTITGFYNGASISTVGFVQVSAASGFFGFGLSGKNSAGSNATAHYDAVSMAAFAYTDGMVAALSSPGYNTVATGPAVPPYVILTGDALPRSRVAANLAGEPGPMVAKGFVESHAVQPANIDGVFYPASKMLTVRLLEK